MIHKDARVAWWRVPRCGSTSLQEALSAGGFERRVVEAAPGYESFAVVREPAERFISTVIFQWTRRRPPLSLGDYVSCVFEHVRRAGSWTMRGDYHFDPQVSFFPEGTRLWPLERVDDVRPWLAARGVALPALEVRRRTLRRMKQEADAFVTSSDLDRVREFYAQDAAAYEAAWLR